MGKRRQTAEEFAEKWKQEKEHNIYRIMKQHNNAIPFEFKSFATLEECEEYLNNYFNALDNEHKKYYVINKYYKNKHECIEPIDKYSIEFRNDKNEWILYEPLEKKVAQEEQSKNNSDYNININLNIKFIK